MDFGGTDELDFIGPRTNLIVTIDVSGCADVSIRADGRNQPSLAGGGTVDAIVLRLLHLPVHYGMPQ